MKAVKFSRTSKINIGDFAISECIEFLHKNAGKGNIISYDLLYENFDVQGRISSADPNKAYRVKRRGKLSSWLVLQLKKILFVLRHRKLYKQQLKDAEAIIIGGGNIFTEVNGSDMFVRCYTLFKMARKQNIPVFVYGVGVGPFDFAYRSRLQKFIMGSSKFVVRDDRSYNFVVQLNDPKVLGKVEVSVDPAFVISDIYKPQATEKRAIGVNFMNFAKLVPGSGFDYQLIADNLKELSKHYKAPIKIINTSFGEDLSIALNMQILLEEDGVSCSIANIDELEKLPTIFGDLKFFVASRMHSSIFAMSYKVPTLIYPWHHKVDGLCTHLFGAAKQNVLLSKANFDIAEIVEKIEKYKSVIDISTIIEDQKAAIYQDYDQLFK